MSRLSRGLQQFIEYVICWPRRHHASLPHTTYPKSEEIWVSGIRMWYFAASQECDRVIISCHGNKRHLGNLLPLIQTFAKLNWNLILFDYHGFGQSETSSDMYSAQGMTQDILQVIEWAHEKFPTKRLFLHGHSLGGALMIRALTQSRLPIEGAILESSFYRLDDVIHYHLCRFLPPWFVDLIIKLLHYLVPQILQDYRTCDQLNHVPCPLTLIHSYQDAVIPRSHLDRISQHCRNRPNSPNGQTFIISGSHAQPIYSSECCEYLRSL